MDESPSDAFSMKVDTYIKMCAQLSVCNGYGSHWYGYSNESFAANFATNTGRLPTAFRDPTISVYDTECATELFGMPMYDRYLLLTEEKMKSKKFTGILGGPCDDHDPLLVEHTVDRKWLLWSSVMGNLHEDILAQSLASGTPNRTMLRWFTTVLNQRTFLIQCIPLAWEGNPHFPRTRGSSGCYADPQYGILLVPRMHW